ncbi:MAG: ATP-binding cassette domain-containing protein, partial [Myxococcales bacterium]|nr:ATP-binding cassette domain-containing protein [Myxococcales bacterium]
MVQLFHVTKRYTREGRALDDLTLRIDKGEFVLITGPSGAGKTTLLKLIFAAERPSAGQLLVAGHAVHNLRRGSVPLLRRNIGVVFQDFRLLRHLSAFDNVALPLRVAGARESDIRRHVSELLTWVGLRDHMEARPPTLSGGQQQRVA